MRTGIAYASNQRVTHQGYRVCDITYRDGTTVVGVAIAADIASPLSIPRADQATNVPAPAVRVLVVWGTGEPKPTVVRALDSPKVLYKAGDFEREGGNGGREDGDDVDDDLVFTYMEETRLPGPQGDIIMRQDGTTVMACYTLSIQVPAGRYVRISEAGDSDGRTMLSAPTTDKLQSMVDTINELRSAVLDMQERLLLLTVAADNSTMATAPTGGPVTGTLRILQTPVYTGAAEAPVDSPALTSAAIHLSTRTEADGT